MADQEFTLSQEFLLHIFEYKDGELYWKNKYKPTSWKKIGSKAGFLHKGYIGLRMNKKFYAVHRLIFLMHNGHLPKFIDHIDGNPLNNKIENLREATQQQNLYNTKLSKKNTSGYKNVILSKKLNKWQVLIRVNGKMKYFGNYFCKDIARFVAETMRYKYHKEFANHG
jgi:predicted glutamine amidotransferase